MRPDAPVAAGRNAVRTVRLGDTHVPPTADVLAAGFVDDPAYTYAIPDPDRRGGALPSFLAAPVPDALPFGTASVAVADREVVGAVIKNC
jgi:hypothetical protein